MLNLSNSTHNISVQSISGCAVSKLPANFYSPAKLKSASLGINGMRAKHMQSIYAELLALCGSEIVPCGEKTASSAVQSAGLISINESGKLCISSDCAASGKTTRNATADTIELFTPSDSSSAPHHTIIKLTPLAVQPTAQSAPADTAPAKAKKAKATKAKAAA